MFCQKCGAVDDGGVRCSGCGSNDFGPERPAAPEVTPTVVRAQVTTSNASSDDGGFGCAVVFVVIAIAVIGWMLGWWAE